MSELVSNGKNVGHVSRETLSPAVAALQERKTCSKCGTTMVKDGPRWRCAPCKAAYQRKWRSQHPLTEDQRRKDIVRSVANVNKKRGKIIEKPCVICGSHGAQMHHKDYSKPLDVTWLCLKCHAAEHYPDAEAKKNRPRRRLVRHGGTLCCRCHNAPPASAKARYCRECRNTYSRERARAERAELKRLRAEHGDQNAG